MSDDDIADLLDSDDSSIQLTHASPFNANNPPGAPLNTPGPSRSIQQFTINASPGGSEILPSVSSPHTTSQPTVAPRSTRLGRLFDDSDKAVPIENNVSSFMNTTHSDDEDDEDDRELQSLLESAPNLARSANRSYHHSVHSRDSTCSSQATNNPAPRPTQQCTCSRPNPPGISSQAHAETPTAHFLAQLGCNPRSGLCANGNPTSCPICSNPDQARTQRRPCNSFNCINRNSDLSAKNDNPLPLSSRISTDISAAVIYPTTILSEGGSDENESDNDGTEDDQNDQNFDASNSKPDLISTPEFANNLLQLNQCSSDATHELPTPTELNVTLLKHQRQALCWMVRRERSENQPAGHPRGGILADDQGFGKTLSLIGLMLTNLPPKRPDSDVHVAWGNLVIAPTSILRQWAGELRDRIDAPYKPRVLIYHGPKRTKDPFELIKYDVVITSYGMLAHEYPKEEKIWDEHTRKIVKKKRTKGPLYRVEWFRVILDEAQAIKNRLSDTHKAARAIYSRRRWVVTGTPIQNTIDDIYALFLFLGYEVVASLKEWNSRYKKILEGNVSQMRRERAFKQFQLLLGPILLRRAKSDKIDGRPVIPLPSRTVRILELKFTKTEAEYYHAQEAQAVLEMNRLMNNASERNVLTSALTILLRLRQACNHPKLCEWGMPGAFRFSDDELDAVDIRMRSKSLFRTLQNDVQERLYRELSPESSTTHVCPVCMDIITLDGIITKCGHFFCKSDFEEWARSNDTCPACRTALLESESMSLEIVRKEVHALARKKNREIEKSAETVVDVKPVKRENTIAARLFGKQELSSDEEVEPLQNPIKKMRVSQNRAFVPRSSKRVKEEKGVVDLGEVAEVKKERMVTRGRKRKAVKRERIEGVQLECTQRENYVPSDDTEDENNVVDDEGEDVEVQTPARVESGTSSKIKSFISEYRNILETTDDKVLCFSQWTRMLDLVQDRLLEEGFEFVRLDGTQSLEERAEAVKMFQRRSKCRLFLISLKAGSTGLNLTVANRVFLLDSWWNPAVEDQAIDRVHRIGQRKDVEVIKMKIIDSVEDRILSLQDKKREVADGVLGKEGLQTIGRRRLSMREVLDLFADVYENVAQRAEQNNDTATMNMVETFMNMSRSL